VRFFVDNNLSPKIARALHALAAPEHEVVHLRDKYKEDTKDEDWMRALAQEHEWVIISGDVRIRKNPHEVKAWREAGHTIFFLRKGWTNIKPFEQASKLFHFFPEIVKLASSSLRGSGFDMPQKGNIKSFYAPGKNSLS
jgi:predicted nuclease of predicted toxin-antitoxin system